MSKGDVSGALGQKLLEGWALLDQYCPQCLTPLVRNRQGKLYCVSCKQWLITESEAANIASEEKSRRKSEEVDNSLSTQVKTLLPSSPPVVEKPTTSEGVGGTLPTQEKEVGPTTKKLDTGGLNSSSLAITSNRNLRDPPPCLPMEDVVLANTHQVLIEKLEDIRCELAVTKDIRDIRQLFGVLEDCLKLIHRVKTLSSKT